MNKLLSVQVNKWVNYVIYWNIWKNINKMSFFLNKKNHSFTPRKQIHCAPILEYLLNLHSHRKKKSEVWRSRSLTNLKNSFYGTNNDLTAECIEWNNKNNRKKKNIKYKENMNFRVGIAQTKHIIFIQPVGFLRDSNIFLPVFLNIITIYIFFNTLPVISKIFYPKKIYIFFYIKTTNKESYICICLSF